jgi:hypothetical protein
MKLSEVIEMNNNAIAVLRLGRYKQAIDLLRTAIAGLKNCVVEHNEEMDFSESSVKKKGDLSPSSSSSASSNDDEMVDQTQGTPAIFSVQLWTEDSFAQKHDNSLIFVYAKALVLAPVDHHRRVLIGVVLYNMALANHARAIEKEKSGLLMVALKFYGMAVAALVRGQPDVDASSYWLLLALYNNMAQIYMSYSSSERLQQCLAIIDDLLAADKIEQVLDVDDHAFFLTNAILQLRVVAAPAA